MATWHVRIPEPDPPPRGQWIGPVVIAVVFAVSLGLFAHGVASLVTGLCR